jgi:hypothetical protein
MTRVCRVEWPGGLLSGQDAALILGLLVAMHRDPELANAVREQVPDAKREVALA